MWHNMLPCEHGYNNYLCANSSMRVCDAKLSVYDKYLQRLFILFAAYVFHFRAIIVDVCMYCLYVFGIPLGAAIG